MDDAIVASQDETWLLVYRLMTDLGFNIGYCKLLQEAGNQNVDLTLLIDQPPPVLPHSHWDIKNHARTDQVLETIAHEGFARVADASANLGHSGDEAWSEPIHELLSDPYLVARLYIIAAPMRAESEPREIDKAVLQKHLSSASNISEDKPVAPRPAIRVFPGGWLAGSALYPAAAGGLMPRRAVVLENVKERIIIHGEMEAWRKAGSDRSWTFRLVFPVTQDQSEKSLALFATQPVRMELCGAEVAKPYIETLLHFAPKIGLSSNPLSLHAPFDDSNLRIVFSIPQEESPLATTGAETKNTSVQ